MKILISNHRWTKEKGNNFIEIKIEIHTLYKTRKQLFQFFL